MHGLKRAVSELSTELAASSDLSVGLSEADKAARLGFNQLLGNGCIVCLRPQSKGL